MEHLFLFARDEKRPDFKLLFPFYRMDEMIKLPPDIAIDLDLLLQGEIKDIAGFSEFHSSENLSIALRSIKGSASKFVVLAARFLVRIIPIRMKVLSKNG